MLDLGILKNCNPFILMDTKHFKMDFSIKKNPHFLDCGHCPLLPLTPLPTYLWTPVGCLSTHLEINIDICINICINIERCTQWHLVPSVTRISGSTQALISTKYHLSRISTNLKKSPQKTWNKSSLVTKTRRTVHFLQH